MEDSPIVLINGARQVGKSTLCKSLIKDHGFAAKYLTFDDPVLLAAAVADPLGFLLDQPDLLILDEIQRAPEIAIGLKKLIDDDRARRRIILSGSANVLALPKLGDSLAGRMDIFELWPLSQDEIMGNESVFLDTLLDPEGRFPSTATDWTIVANVLSMGGYPTSVDRRSVARRMRWFDSYLQSVLQKDVQKLARSRDLLIFRIPYK